jgi:hypothetical protein
LVASDDGTQYHLASKQGLPEKYLLARRADFTQPTVLIATPASHPDDGVFEAGQLLVLKPGAAITLTATQGRQTVLMLLGGEPMAESRYLSWNFVSSSEERIAQAKDDWRERRFPTVPGDEAEFISLSDLFQ